MIVDPYKRAPVPPTVCLLLPDGSALSEHGETLSPSPDSWPDGYRCFVDYDTVRELVNAGTGEALCWNSEEIKWRPSRLDPDGWKRRRSDVSVIRLPFPQDPWKALAGLVGWRDWLRRHGAAPPGTSGAASWSLLRATLDQVLFCTQGAAPPLVSTVGGRQEIGPSGPGSFRGELVQLDLQAAYARELAGLSYGGWWVHSDDLPPGHGFDWWHGTGRPVFVRCRVRLGGGRPGPLVRRPRGRSRWNRPLSSLVEQERRYPVDGVIQGVWTSAELEAACGEGARIVHVYGFWVHIATRRPFARWWEAIEEGRAMPGLAGTLAKVTGNALWGRFCMDTRAQGRRTIRGVGRRGKLESRPLPFQGGMQPAHDLAETVSGRVRAEMFRQLAQVGDRLVCAHTDGLWATGGDIAPAAGEGLAAAEWRLKERASRLDLIDPQAYRYWTRPSAPWDPVVKLAGWPWRQAGEEFERRWQANREETAA